MLSGVLIYTAAVSSHKNTARNSQNVDKMYMALSMQLNSNANLHYSGSQSCHKLLIWNVSSEKNKALKLHSVDELSKVCACQISECKYHSYRELWGFIIAFNDFSLNRLQHHTCKYHFDCYFALSYGAFEKCSHIA